MPQVDFNLEDFRKMLDEQMDKRFVKERDHTKQLVRNEVNVLRGEFQSFIEMNFEPAVKDIDNRFDDADDRLDRLTKDVTELRIEVRHIKQALRTRAAT